MLWENCFVGLFWYIINCIGPLWYYRVLVATVVLLRSLAAVITNNGLEPKTAACCGQINVLMVRLKISYQLVSLLCCQHLCSSVKISQRLINRRPGMTGSPERLLTHKIPRVPTFCRWRPILIFTPWYSGGSSVSVSICITFGGIWPPLTRATRGWDYIFMKS